MEQTETLEYHVSGFAQFSFKLSQSWNNSSNADKTFDVVSSDRNPANVIEAESEKLRLITGEIIARDGEQVNAYLRDYHADIMSEQLRNTVCGMFSSISAFVSQDLNYMSVYLADYISAADALFDVKFHCQLYLGMPQRVCSFASHRITVFFCYISCCAYFDLFGPLFGSVSFGLDWIGSLLF